MPRNNHSYNTRANSNVDQKSYQTPDKQKTQPRNLSPGKKCDMASKMSTPEFMKNS